MRNRTRTSERKWWMAATCIDEMHRWWTLLCRLEQVPNGMNGCVRFVLAQQVIELTGEYQKSEVKREVSIIITCLLLFESSPVQ